MAKVPRKLREQVLADAERYFAPVKTPRKNAIATGFLAFSVALSGFVAMLVPGTIFPSADCSKASVCGQKIAVLYDSPLPGEQGLSEYFAGEVIDGIALSISWGSRLDLYSINPELSKPATRVFSRVIPPQRDEVSAWTHNLQAVETEYNDFRRELVEVNSALIRKPGEDSSPICASLASIDLRSLQKEVEGDARLIIVSDLMFHTNEYSAYRHPRQPLAEYFEQCSLDLAEISVDLIIPRRSLQIQDEVVQAWRTFLTSSGATIARVVFMPVGNSAPPLHCEGNPSIEGCQ